MVYMSCAMARNSPCFCVLPNDKTSDHPTSLITAQGLLHARHLLADRAYMSIAFPEVLGSAISRLVSRPIPNTVFNIVETSSSIDNATRSRTSSRALKTGDAYILDTIDALTP